MTAFLPALSRPIAAATLAAGLVLGAGAGEPAGAADAATVAARAALAAAPAPGTAGTGFIANRGQWAAEVLYMTPIKGGRAWVTAKGIVYDFSKPAKRKQDKSGAQPPEAGPKDKPKARPQTDRVRGYVVRLSFAGAAPPTVRPTGRIKTRLNYLIGNDVSRHAANVPASAAVSLDGLWPGVDLRLAQVPGGLSVSFNAVDAAALARVRVFVDGASLLEGRGEGAVVATSIGQRSLGSVGVSLGSARYAGRLTGGTVSLASSRPVATQAASESGGGLVYSTFLGSSGNEYGEALAVDASGSAYVTGWVYSSDFPTTPGAYDRTFSGGSDAFVTKLAADGSALVYSTFLGGRGGEYGSALAVDASGMAYVAGATSSKNFPTTPGAFDRTYNGCGGHQPRSDAFVIKLSADGSSLVYSTFLGGSVDDESVADLAVDTGGAVYVTGDTSSQDFPTTPGAYDTTISGTDAFVTKLAADGSALVYSTFLGGRYDDLGNALAVDASGAAYIAGQAYSTDFPSTPGAYDTTHNGDYTDAFVTKLAADGSALVYSTFLGGSDYDGGYGLAVDASGVAYVTGFAHSSDFPTTPGAYDTTHNGGDSDAFVTQLSADGSALGYSTFLGGSAFEGGYRLAVDASGAAYVTGKTQSQQFPTTPGAYSTTHNGGEDDGFVSKLSADGRALVSSTFLGGGNDDESHGLAVDASGAAYVTGLTGSRDFPTTPGAFDTTFDGGIDLTDAFVTKLDFGGGASGVDLSATASPTTVAAGGSFTVDYTVSNNTGDAVTGDLGLTAVRSGNVVGYGAIVSNATVAAHGARSGSYMQQVPSNAAPGIYTYTLRIGQFPNRVADKVSFTITVTGAERAGGGATAWKVTGSRR